MTPQGVEVDPQESSSGGSTGILPYVAAFLLLVAILLIAWYLFGKNRHTISATELLFVAIVLGNGTL